MLSAIFVAVLAGLLIAAVAGVILMYRQVGQLHTAINGLAKALDAMDEGNTATRRETREDIARIHLRIDDLVKRPI